MPGDRRQDNCARVYEIQRLEKEFGLPCTYDLDWASASASGKKRSGGDTITEDQRTLKMSKKHARGRKRRKGEEKLEEIGNDRLDVGHCEVLTITNHRSM